MLIWINSPKARSSNFVLLDRDGVINEDSPDFITRWDEYHFYPDALDALKWLNENRIEAILVSNQSGLNRGIIGWESFWDVHHRMVAEIQKAGGAILAAFYCPHRPDEGCRCRKPLPGMILKASRLYSIPLHRTVMIGDRETDLQSAALAGAKGLLLHRDSSSSRERDHQPSPGGSSDVQYTNLWEAILDIPQFGDP